MTSSPSSSVIARIPPRWGRAIRGQLGLLHPALARREEHVAAGREVPHRQGGGHPLPLREVQEVDERLAPGVPLGLGDLVDLQPVDLAVVGEEQEVGVRRGDVHVLDDVLLLGLHAGDALAAPALAPVGLDGRPLDVARPRDGDDHLLVGDQVLEGELDRLLDDLGPPLVGVLRLEGEQLVLDDLPHEGVGGEDRPQPLDELEHLGVLLDHLLALELRQALEPHVQDGLRLDLAQLELAHQRLAGGVDARRGPDQADHQVEVVERLPEALQDVGALLGAREVVAGAPDHDLPPEVDEVVEHLPERDHLRPPADEGQHVDAERRLHRGVLVELVEDDLRDLALPQLQHHPDPVPVRLVADLGEAVELPLARELGDLRR